MKNTAPLSRDFAAWETEAEQSGREEVALVFISQKQRCTA